MRTHTGTNLPRSCSAQCSSMWVYILCSGVYKNRFPSQFIHVPKDRSVYNASVYCEYVDLVSKNNQHQFKDINSTNKMTRAYTLPGNGQCVVKLLDKYLDLLPPYPLQPRLRAHQQLLRPRHLTDYGNVIVSGSACIPSHKYKSAQIGATNISLVRYNTFCLLCNCLLPEVCLGSLSCIQFSRVMY